MTQISAPTIPCSSSAEVFVDGMIKRPRTREQVAKPHRRIRGFQCLQHWKLTHKERSGRSPPRHRRGGFKPAGTLELNRTIDIPVRPDVTLQVRSSPANRTKTFGDVADGLSSAPMRRKASCRFLPMLRRSQPGTLTHTRVD